MRGIIFNFRFKGQKNICTEMKRLLKPNGIIIWIDSSLKNYKTEDDGEVYFKSISKEELKSYFMNCKVEWYPNIYLKPCFICVANDYVFNM